MANIFDFETSIVPWVNLGFKYRGLLLGKYIPTITTSLHQFIPADERTTMQFDLELFLESRAREVYELYQFKDYDIRLLFFYFLERPELVENTNGKVYAVHKTVFCGLSYKSPENLIGAKPTESGQSYTGLSGFGFEIVYGARFMGFRELGFSEDSLFKMSLFFNFSEYFTSYPPAIAGFKIRFLY